jgi:hypothetical protein
MLAKIWPVPPSVSPTTLQPAARPGTAVVGVDTVDGGGAAEVGGAAGAATAFGAS